MYPNSSFSKLCSRKAAQEINVRHLNTHDQYIIKSDGRSGRQPWTAICRKHWSDNVCYQKIVYNDFDISGHK